MKLLLRDLGTHEVTSIWDTVVLRVRIQVRRPDMGTLTVTAETLKPGEGRWESLDGWYEHVPLGTIRSLTENDLYKQYEGRALERVTMILDGYGD